MKTLLVIISAIIYFFTEIITKLTELITLFFAGFTYILKTLGIALAGGFVDYLINIRENGENFSFKKALLNTFIAGFAGFLTVQLCLYFKVEPNLMGFLCGISGFAGVRALRFFEHITQKTVTTISRVKFELEENKKDGKEKVGTNNDDGNSN